MRSKDHIPKLALHAVLASCAILAILPSVLAKELSYTCSNPLLEVTFKVLDNHYSGEVSCGNLFLQSDIPTAPIVRWKPAKTRKYYTLLMLDLDGNAAGSYPHKVAPGQNAPLRHWIVGNIPGQWLRKRGYLESGPKNDKLRILQPYRSPHIPVVSDRYGFYLFEQHKEIDFAPLSGPITNFDYLNFIEKYKLGEPKASNYFVAIFTSESPFSGKTFSGHDVSGKWHQGYGKGTLAPATPTANPKEFDW